MYFQQLPTAYPAPQSLKCVQALGSWPRTSGICHSKDCLHQSFWSQLHYLRWPKRMLICFSRKDTKVPGFVMGDQTLERVKSTKIQALVVSANLSWRQHVDSITVRATSAFISCAWSRELTMYICARHMPLLYQASVKSAWSVCTCCLAWAEWHDWDSTQKQALG